MALRIRPLDVRAGQPSGFIGEPDIACTSSGDGSPRRAKPEGCLAGTGSDELRRLLRDLDHEKQMAEQQARLQPWRR
jgi:hypothetical protein